jgi:biopolymer transport protein ExbD
VLRRPSARRKREISDVQLNLVPILDAMVTLITFLLYTMSFLAIVSIESPFPEASPAINQKKLDQPPLQLTLSIREGETEIWSPFQKIEPQKFPHLEAGKPDTSSIHEALLAIKQQFPQENQVVVAPHPSLNYDALIGVMDSARTLEPTDPPIYFKNETTGMDEAAKSLFGDVVFGNLLGEE